jgi:hypothetical protein
VTQRREVFVGNTLGDKSTAFRFLSQPGSRHAASRKGNFGSHFEP